MIEFKQGNIFDSTMQYITIPVNCVGVLGKGLALEFKNKYPVAADTYARICKSGGLKIGIPVPIIADKKYFIMFPTKHHWKDNSRIEWIREGLDYFYKQQKMCPSIFSIAIPALGCGLGKLEWDKVKDIMVGHLEGLNIPIEIYEPVVDSLSISY